jgi:chorismate mutase
MKLYDYLESAVGEIKSSSWSDVKKDREEALEMIRQTGRDMLQQIKGMFNKNASQKENEVEDEDEDKAAAEKKQKLESIRRKVNQKLSEYALRFNSPTKMAAITAIQNKIKTDEGLLDYLEKRNKINSSVQKIKEQKNLNTFKKQLNSN